MNADKWIIPDAIVARYGKTELFQYICLICKDKFFPGKRSYPVCDECKETDWKSNIEKWRFVDEKHRYNIIYHENRTPIAINTNRPTKNLLNVIKRDKLTCQYCGYKSKYSMFVDLQVDHLIPYSCGGSNEMDNLVLACQDCNLIASDKVFEDFAEKKEYIVNERIKKKKPIYDYNLCPFKEQDDKTQRRMLKISVKHALSSKNSNMGDRFCLNPECNRSISHKRNGALYCNSICKNAHKNIINNEKTSAKPRHCKYSKCRRSIAHLHKNLDYCNDTGGVCQKGHREEVKRDKIKKERARLKKLAKQLCSNEFLDLLHNKLVLYNTATSRQVPIRFLFDEMRLLNKYKISNPAEPYILQHLEKRHPGSMKLISRKKK